eukprot:gb/GEZN01004507.1/.p1 GENE.gb/GEZN01004507.1/~~gb/GEZN01004507.1/.p1  ORF type:complete len:445 (+),score=68.18 gb/GEZN01004507.1/:159-1493(+)
MKTSDKRKDEIAVKILSQKNPRKTAMKIPAWYWADYYAVALIIPFGCFSIFVYWLFSFLLLPLILWGRLANALWIPRPTDLLGGRRKDNGEMEIACCGSFMWQLMLYVTLPYGLLLYALHWATWLVIFLGSLVLSLPALVIRVVFLCQLRSILNNFYLLWPYMRMNRQSYFKTAVAIMGEADRQGVWELVFGKCGSSIPGGLATSITIIPCMKYFFQANPLLFKLEEVHINQWTPPILFVPDGIKDREGLIKDVRILVSRYLHTLEKRKANDKVLFAAHYPWPRDNFKTRESVTGIQWPERSKTVNFTTTTHVIAGNNSFPLLENGKWKWVKDSPIPRCPEGAYGIYEVRLYWLANHFLTGYVEVNYRKDGGLEHPMYCILDPNSHWAMTTYEFVNDLFEAFVPDVVRFTQAVEGDTDKSSPDAIVAIEEGVDAIADAVEDGAG